MPYKGKDRKAQRRSRVSLKREHPVAPARATLSPPPAGLRHVEEAALGSMAPGDVIFLGETESLKTAVESIFFAVLACPVCGTLGLITSAQYVGAVPVVCGSNQCSCRFRIEEGSRFTYLPVN
ncbi:MAG: hypothetical protein HYS33_08715 [Acidobacteria bacterium]|nr:hypothetical protein [Acidobacteriota bacterium]MBI1982641.1 hypothetical protein [Acidobacteriota bacterium]